VAGADHRMAPYVAVVGPSGASAAETGVAEAVGRGLGEAGAIVVTGGLAGVMAAACKGCASAGGTSVGILPGSDREAANEHVTLAIATGLGELRNGLVVRAADVVIAVGGGYGTLSEVALALRADKPVVGLGGWEIEGVEEAESPAEAVHRALTLIGCPPSSPPI
jgi:uncharacterized protein (TIGR00725 family)